ncbi:MAG TPA: ribosomal protein S18-alanine N-acetyltransferase [Pyrinomonadaceae bacterium]|nr:ribosomal protein S18-alanine N-acetyltransferase [Pyrinomonadaceae bacterium]
MSNTGVEKSLTESCAVIAQMTEHDLLEVVEIEESSGLSRWGWDAYFGELARSSETVMLVARPEIEERSLDRSSILGFIASRLTADELHINNMAVREGMRQSGIGSQLLGAALEEGRRRGARRAFLEVRASNVAAQRLYGKFGFTLSGRRSGYYAEPSEDALVMTAQLL